jgi:hypothetical protein
MKSRFASGNRFTPPVLPLFLQKVFQSASAELYRFQVFWANEATIRSKLRDRLCRSVPGHMFFSRELFSNSYTGLFDILQAYLRSSSSCSGVLVPLFGLEAPAGSGILVVAEGSPSSSVSAARPGPSSRCDVPVGASFRLSSPVLLPLRRRPPSVAVVRNGNVASAPGGF